MMIRALFRKQLRELGAAFLRSSKTGKARSRASAVGYALLFAVLVVVLMLCFAGMALPLASVLLPAGLDWLYFASMGLTALLVSVLASAFTSYSGLFQSRDNELLLSLPIPPAVIFGVRVSTVYLACLIYLLMAWVPAVVCYGLLAAHPLAGVLCSIPMALVLAGAACILAVLLGWAVALANDRARHKSLVTVVCSLVFFALYYAGFLRVQDILDDLLADAAQSGAAVPVRGCARCRKSRRLRRRPAMCRASCGSGPCCWAARRQGSSRRWSASCWAQCCALRPFASCWKSPTCAA